MTRKMLGSVDQVGLGDFGAGPMSTWWGAAFGGGASFAVGSLASHMGTGKVQTNSDLIGLAAGLATAGGLYASRRTRRFAGAAVLGAVLVSGLKYLERVLLGTVQLPTATAAAAATVAAGATPGVSGLGLSTTRALNGLGISRTRALNGAMGIATTGMVPHAVGTIPGVAGPRIGNGAPPVSLMGPRSAGAAQVALMGGPQIHGVAGHWGATHFSR